jgi:hypothetical protein
VIHNIKKENIGRTKSLKLANCIEYNTD